MLILAIVPGHVPCSAPQPSTRERGTTRLARFSKRCLGPLFASSSRRYFFPAPETRGGSGRLVGAERRIPNASSSARTSKKTKITPPRREEVGVPLRGRCLPILSPAGNKSSSVFLFFFAVYCRGRFSSLPDGSRRRSHGGSIGFDFREWLLPSRAPWDAPTIGPRR